MPTTDTTQVHDRLLSAGYDEEDVTYECRYGTCDRTWTGPRHAVDSADVAPDGAGIPACDEHMGDDGYMLDEDAD
jgi:hypothetical protein